MVEQELFYCFVIGHPGGGRPCRATPFDIWGVRGDILRKQDAHTLVWSYLPASAGNCSDTLRGVMRAEPGPRTKSQSVCQDGRNSLCHHWWAHVWFCLFYKALINELSTSLHSRCDSFLLWKMLSLSKTALMLVFLGSGFCFWAECSHVYNLLNHGWYS